MLRIELIAEATVASTRKFKNVLFNIAKYKSDCEYQQNVFEYAYLK